MFICDLSSDLHESIFTQQTMDDFGVTDPNLLVDDIHDCTSLSSRVQTRSDFCATETHYFAVGTKADLQKYWRSQIDIKGFANSCLQSRSDRDNISRNFTIMWTK